MLYFIYGTETEKVRAKKDELIASCHKKRPDAEIFVLDTDNFSESAFQSLYSSQGLFEQKHIAVLDGLLSFKDTKEIVSDALKKLAASQSVFILLEGAVDAKTATLGKKHAEKSYEFGEKKESKKDYSAFAITDALAAKDRKTAWLNYQKAIRSGNAPEALQGAIFWQTKTMLLAKKTGAFNKFSRNWSEKELDEMLERLTDIYHGIRAEGGELEYELEKFLLGK